MAGGVDEEVLHQLYLWVDNIPLSRPKRNLSRDFSDAVLAAEVVKFYFPKMVEMHNYVPANSVQQKINNWIHLNRKVLHKLNFSVPEDVIQKIAQCSPGVVELVLIPLRQRLEEKKQRKQGVGSSQELDLQEGSNYMDMDFSQKTPRGGTMEPWKAGQLRGGKLLPAASRAMQGDPNFVVQMAEKEQELLASQETVQIWPSGMRNWRGVVATMGKLTEEGLKRPRVPPEVLVSHPRPSTWYVCVSTIQHMCTVHRHTHTHSCSFPEFLTLKWFPLAQLCLIASIPCPISTTLHCLSSTRTLSSPLLLRIPCFLQNPGHGPPPP
uniref:Sperm flagellar protein 1 n=1 Tax=Phascolarctos cinereus TaxID=38626 RepID=A0A6P5LJY7_PHACI|nr:sperm flagellar protein 1 isoform X3 [Phascolarctos cinereus]